MYNLTGTVRGLPDGGPGKEVTKMLVSLAILWAANAQAADFLNFEGGLVLPPEQTSNCIPLDARRQLAELIASHEAVYGIPPNEPAAIQPYELHPQAGTIGQDLIITNFVDLDSLKLRLRVYNCQHHYTYDGHTGHDIAIRSFGEQDIGVPVFAAVAGTVVATGDGQFDRSIRLGKTGKAALGNFVVLRHANDHFTIYMHLRKGSVSVNVNQAVTTGTQLGMIASAGNSTGPHLHFDSAQRTDFVQWRNFGSFEPNTGGCYNGHMNQNWWKIAQPDTPLNFFVYDFNLTDANMAQWIPPNDYPRRGTWVRGFRNVGMGMLLCNIPPNSTYRIRYLTAAGFVGFDSGNRAFGNAGPIKFAPAWWQVQGNLLTLGTWFVEFRLNGAIVLRAPFNVVANDNQVVNRNPVNLQGAVFEPAAPKALDPVRVRIQTNPIFDDQDYDLVRYRYQWTVNGNPARDVVIAALSDVLAVGNYAQNDTVRCTITALDGRGGQSPAVNVQVVIQ